MVANDQALDSFLAYVAAQGLSLYPAQEEAILEIFSGRHVILNTPTGSGKSLVALAAHFAAVQQGERSVYTAPIKALVNEKFFALCEVFGADQVGLATGDSSVHAEAPILCCTAEILAARSLREGAASPFRWVVMDEFHFYGDRQRGVAWQLPLLTMSAARFLLMSATMSDAEVFTERLSRLAAVPTRIVRSSQRPVPLEFSYRETPLHETLLDLLEQDRAPIYLVHFSQREACEKAQDLLSVDALPRPSKQSMLQELRTFAFPTPYGRELKRLLQHGIGVHHAGLLPRYRRLVERLAQKGLLKIICGTDTLGVGVNIPIRTVLFSKLCKFDGDKVKVLSVRDFHQISGRAGRKGFDEVGYVVVQAPEHAVENRIIELKTRGDTKQRRKAIFKKPPEKGYAHWDAATLQRLLGAAAEPLASRFRIAPWMIMQLVARGEDGCAALRPLIEASHERPVMQRRHGRAAVHIVRSLLQAGVLQKGPRGLLLHEALQDDYSLQRSLSFFVLHALQRLEPEREGRAMLALTLVESTLEDPQAVLERQRDRLRKAKLAELKAAGVDFDTRIAMLDEIDYPQPEREWLLAQFEDFTAANPWMLDQRLRPKSIARDMLEGGQTFTSYVRFHGLQRAEGTLLRYLTDVYKTLLQGVPHSYHDEALLEMLAWLRSLLQQVDASLMDEWRALQQLDATSETAAVIEPPPLISDAQLMRMARNATWRLLLELAGQRYEQAIALLGSDEDETPWRKAELEAAMQPFLAAHGAVRTDPAARQSEHTVITRDGDQLTISQALLDEAGESTWALRLRVDLQESRTLGGAVLHLLEVTP